MLDISKLSKRYAVRLIRDEDADDILAFCRQNTLFYQYCGKQPSREMILQDLHITPPGTDASSKYYVGFYDRTTLMAVLDLIDGYPDSASAYIGFFMMNRSLQGRHIGSGIIEEVCDYLRETGIASVRLGIDKENPQSTHFWKRNGFQTVKEVERDGWTAVVAEKTL